MIRLINKIEVLKQNKIEFSCLQNRSYLENQTYYLNDVTTKQVFISHIQPTIKYNCLTNANFTKTRNKKMNMLDMRAEFILGNDILLHDGGLYHIDTSPLVCIVNQWTDFCMIRTSVIKELNVNTSELIYKHAVKRVFVFVNSRALFSALGPSVLGPHLVGLWSQNIARLNAILLFNFEVVIILKL